MALTDENGGMNTTMLVSPSGGFMGNGSGGFGNAFGNDGWWIILLFLLLIGGGWNNGYGHGAGMGQPFVVNDGGSVQRGFDQAAIMGGINGVQSGVQNLSTQLCSCCGDIRDTVNSGFNAAEIAANSRQMANMQTAFAGQTAMAQGFNSVASQLANCCCENRLSSADLKYTIAT